MTNNKQTTASKKPTYIAYHVRDSKEGNGFFTRIGAAWPNADGKGFNLQFEVIPLDGRVTLRLNSEKPESSDKSE